MRNKSDLKNKMMKKATAKTPSANVNPETQFYENKTILVFLFLLITFIAYLPSLSADFIPTWDDNIYITDNPLIRSLSLTNLKSIFTSNIGGSYVPLPLLTFAVEYNFWGLNPLPYHITNLLLHLLGTFLVFQILCKLRIKTSFAAVAALLYGIHPMGVESVAWATERKDVLYTAFYFGSILLYLNYIQSEAKKKLLLLFSIGLFVLSLLSKIQAVSLPLVLISIDFYFERHWRFKLALEKVSYFLLSLLFGIGGVILLKNAGALNVNEMFTIAERSFFGTYALSAYLLKFFVPITLSAMHPYPVSSGNTLPLLYYLSPLCIILTGFIVYRTYSKTRAIVFGTVFFLISIVFMLQVFGAGQGFLADRFTKVPYLGLVYIVGWSLEQFHTKFKTRMPVIWLVFGIYSLVLITSTYNRCKVWKNGETLWTDVIGKYPGKDARPYGCRGLYYKEQNENDKALADMDISLALDKSDFELTIMRGNIYFEKGLDDLAYSDYIHVEKLKVENPLALGNLGAIYIRRNQYDSAIYYLSKSIHLDSSLAIAYANRAVAYGKLGKTIESIEDFKHYLIFNPNDELVYSSIGIAYQSLGQYQESIEWVGKAISLKPEYGNYYYIRSQIYNKMGRRDLALTDGVKARDLGISISPGYLESLK